jgi:protein-export membrane protein SecD
MKRCPVCSRVYDDDSLRFCFDDGTTLVNKLPEALAPETAVLPSSQSNPAPTIEAAPPLVAPVHPVGSPIPAGKRRSPLPWILGAGALLLVLGAGVVIAIFLLIPKKPLVMHLVLQVDSSTPDQAAAVKQSVAVISSRLSALRVSNFEVKPDGDPGNGRILVNLPAVQDPERVKAVIIDWGKLELTHIISPPSPQITETFATKEEAMASIGSDTIPENRRVLPYTERDEPGQAGSPTKWVVVEAPAIVTGSELRNATAVRSPNGGTVYEIQFSLNKTGADKFGAWTGANINEYLGVVLNDEVKSIAFIKSQISDQGVISGRFSKQSAEDLALVLNSGALPGRLLYLEEKVDKP